MAISLRGSASNSSTTDAIVTVTLPGGTAEDDVVYFAYAFGSVADPDMSMNTSGYTELADLYAPDGFSQNTGVFRKVMGGTPDSSAASSAHGGHPSAAIAAVCMVLEGVDTTTPEDATPTTAALSDTNIPDPPSITTVTDAAWVLAVGGPTTFEDMTAPTGYSDLVTIKASGAFDVGNVGMARKEIASAGAEDPGVFGGLSDSSVRAACAVTIAVRPAAAASGRIMGALAGYGGLAGPGGLAGERGGLAA